MRRPLRLFFSFDARLHEELHAIARQHQALRMHSKGTVIWGSVAAAIGLLLAIRLLWAEFAPWLAPLVALAFLTGGIVTAWHIIRDHLDIIDAARRIERDHPELKAALRTAAEQRPDSKGKLNFMQRRLLRHALDHAGKNLWHQTPRRQSRWYAVAHVTSLAATLGLAYVSLKFAAPLQLSWPDFSHVAEHRGNGIEITPGNAEIEHGSTVVVAARFNDDFPQTATLVWQRADGAAGESAMARSLSDPVFAFTLSNIEADTVYRIEHDGEATEDFALTVFELPALVRADAALDYPEYTALTDQTITDTRRVSAVAGTGLDYTFVVNRPLAEARLISTDGTDLPLEPRNDEGTLFGLRTTLDVSHRFQLHLTDREGRTDPDPADIRIEALPNNRPDLTLEFPRGDLRVTPLEELELQATARDDYGLLDHGIAYSIGSEDPNYISFGDTSSQRVLESQFEHLLALESHDVEVSELITWFAWADDYGPTGESRRTTSDLFFAEVRPFDEIFRESDGGQQQGQGGGGGPAGDLLEIQRQLSIAIWNLQQNGETGPTFADDVTTLQLSQEEARTQLAELRGQLSEPAQQGAAALADQSMGVAISNLADAASDVSIESLQPAWTGAQSAFRALLKLQPDETNVAQNSGGGGGGNRNQSQLNQLRFRRDQDNYATESEAEPPASPEEREQLNVLSRLRELARRQNDLNERLQELQTALAAANDEAEREEIRRELKRLEEEQRQMLADLDETRQRVDNMQAGDQRQQAQQQLEETRDDMQRAGEELAEGNVSQALASGTRARESLESTGEDLRENSSSLFSDQMRELRRQARDLTERQAAVEEQWNDLQRGTPSLDDSGPREELATAVESQRERYEQLMDRLREVSSDSEGAEPALHRRLYDVVRQQGTNGTEEQLRASGELLSRGFVDEARREQNGVARAFDRLQEGVERAASSVLGDEASELRFAQNELNDLARQMRDEQSQADRSQPGNERGPGESQRDGEGTAPSASGEEGEALAGTEPSPDATGSGLAPSSDTESAQTGQAGGPGQPGEGEESQLASAAGGSGAPSPGESPSPSGQPGLGGGADGEPNSDSQSPGNGSGSDALEQIAQALGTQLAGGGGGNATERGPLTGGNFSDWADRLRTIESLMEQPDLRQQLSQARNQAEEMRREWQRDAIPPQWDLVESGIIEPLEEARGWLRQELARREDPSTLQPIDRDPVPEKYAESVRKYYEALSAATSEDANDAR